MKKAFKEISYVGKEVFIGIDVHKKSYAVVARVGGEVVKKWTTTASPQALAQQLLKYFAGATIYSAYEAGFSAFVLHRELEKNGIQNKVVNAAGIEVGAFCITPRKGIFQIGIGESQSTTWATFTPSK